MIKKEKGQSPRCQRARKWLREGPLPPIPPTPPQSVFPGAATAPSDTSSSNPNHPPWPQGSLYWPSCFPKLRALATLILHQAWTASLLLCSLGGEAERGRRGQESDPKPENLSFLRSGSPRLAHCLYGWWVWGGGGGRGTLCPHFSVST